MASRLLLKGERACFPRPEFQHDLVTYGAIPPTTAARIFAAIHSVPAICWRIVEIAVVRPIRYGWTSIDRAGGGRICFLEDVEYVVTARFDLTAAATAEDHPARHQQIFHRRAKNGRSIEPIYLGLPQYAASFDIVQSDEVGTDNGRGQAGLTDLGWMPYDDDGPPWAARRYFHAMLANGAIRIPPIDVAILAG